MTRAGRNLARRAPLAALLLVNFAIYVISLVAEVASERGGTFFARALERYNDVMPVPCNAWTCGFHFPSVFLAGLVLGGVQDRSSWQALVLPQLTFIVASSLQVALVVECVLLLIDARRRHRAR
jgi:hypothetical protein